MFGYGVLRYIVFPTTSGAPSWPRNTPVENVHATLRFFTLPALISSSVLYRVDAAFLFGIVHSLSGLLAEDAAAVLVVLVFVEPEQPSAPSAPTRLMTLNNRVHVCIRAPLVERGRRVRFVPRLCSGD